MPSVDTYTLRCRRPIAEALRFFQGFVIVFIGYYFWEDDCGDPIEERIDRSEI